MLQLAKLAGVEMLWFAGLTQQGGIEPLRHEARPPQEQQVSGSAYCASRHVRTSGPSGSFSLGSSEPAYIPVFSSEALQTQ